MPGFGRIVAPDARDHNYLMRSALAVSPPLRTTRMYRTGPVLNQGETSACVGYAWRDWLSAGLIMERSGPDAPALYIDAQVLDGMPVPHEGSTVRAGAQALAGLGFIQTYVWAFDAAAVRDWLLWGKGSVVLGTDWLAGMDAPDTSGTIHAIGDVRGGHAYLCVGYDGARQAFRMLNSWGRVWGQHGRAWLPFADLDMLLHRDGEACTAVEKRLTPAGM